MATFDKIFDQAMMVADALTDGIVKQFPDRASAFNPPAEVPMTMMSCPVMNLFGFQGDGRKPCKLVAGLC